MQHAPSASARRESGACGEEERRLDVGDDAVETLSAARSSIEPGPQLDDRRPLVRRHDGGCDRHGVRDRSSTARTRDAPHRAAMIAQQRRCRCRDRAIASRRRRCRSSAAAQSRVVSCSPVPNAIPGISRIGLASAAALCSPSLGHDDEAGSQRDRRQRRLPALHPATVARPDRSRAGTRGATKPWARETRAARGRARPRRRRRRRGRREPRSFPDPRRRPRPRGFRPLARPRSRRPTHRERAPSATLPTEGQLKMSFTRSKSPRSAVSTPSSSASCSSRLALLRR